jgi:hypothetical protein
MKVINMGDSQCAQGHFETQESLCYALMKLRGVNYKHHKYYLHHANIQRIN